MLIVALVLAAIGLAALVTAVVTSNELVAWVCIGASALGVVLLIIDALRERRSRDVGEPASEPAGLATEDYPEDLPDEAGLETEAVAEPDAGLETEAVGEPEVEAEASAAPVGPESDKGSEEEAP